ncbi:uncharacterized protein [Cicer arietinum]|uniref:Ethylene-responsive transcription factor ERF018-like n=1 Tax=Cicer arietinum TaxID=3827 RepID=A0A1S2Y3W8_CICAR|nr:ethylene-responsive transcription factor ERF018-like [Cicer arietinum]
MAGSNPTTTNNNNSCSNNNTSNNKLYKGVRKRKWGKWVSEIRLPNSRERIWLGSYDTQEKAARAFDAALFCLRGRHAGFNFPNTPLSINVPFHGHNSLSPQEIQEVASKFANDPPIELTQEDQDQQVPLESQNNSVNSNNSNSLYDHNNDGSVQVDYGDLRMMDWRFDDMLDDLNEVACSDSGLYSGLEKMQYSTQLFEEDNVYQIEGEDAFSNHSFLWSWNF